MKIIIAGSVTSAPKCKCGWAPPKEITLVPAAMLKGFLANPTASIKPFVESIAVTCPSCGTSALCGEAKIVK